MGLLDIRCTFLKQHVCVLNLCEFILPSVRSIISSVCKGLWRFSTKKYEAYFLGTFPAPQIQNLQNPWEFERKEEGKNIK